jgi:hypothetical protein
MTGSSASAPAIKGKRCLASNHFDRMSKEPKFSKGDKIELLEDVGFSRAGAKGTVVEQLDDDAVMIDVKAKRFSPVGRQTAVVKPSEIRPRG